MEFEEIDVWRIKMPWWLGFEPLHSSHRANLLRKDPEYYSKHNWTEDPADPYVWHDKENKWYKQHVGIPRKEYFPEITSEKVASLSNYSYIKV